MIACQSKQITIVVSKEKEESDGLVVVLLLSFSFTYESELLGLLYQNVPVSSFESDYLCLNRAVQQMHDLSLDKIGQNGTKGIRVGI